MTDSAEKMRKADRTRIFFDTEFIENGKTIDLISIGMVRSDGETYYAESSDCDLSRADQWVKDNVLIHLRGGSAIKSRRQIAADIVAFAGPSPEFWAYYADYDWVVLCQLYGRMIDLPKGWPMFCRDLKQLAGDTMLPQQISTEHHALADAKWAAEAFAALSARGTKSDGEVKEPSAPIAGLEPVAWQPIKTAPRDGTPILCFTPDYQSEFSDQSGIDVLWFDGGAWLYNAVPVTCQPTHWMPLPASPNFSSSGYYTRAQLEAHAAEQVRAERKRIATWHDDAAIRTRSSDA